MLDWNSIPDDLQLTLSGEAMRRAARTIAQQAEILAAEMEDGNLADRGGPDALRLLAAVVRIADDSVLPGAMAGITFAGGVAGHA